jgi:CP family cyanate transporter-like MFS transporter
VRAALDRAAATERSDSTAAVLVALVVAGLGLRSALLAVGPLAPEISADLDVSHSVTGLLTTLPLLLMGLSAVVATGIGERLGDRMAIGLSLAAIAVGSLCRALVPGIAPVLLLTIPIGVGIGVCGVLLPVFVKHRLPQRPAMATGLYVSGIIIGSSLTVSAAVPLSLASGGWRGALFVFGLATAVSAVAWFVLVDPIERPTRGPIRMPNVPWRRPVAWLLVAMFALQALLFYGLITWLVPALVERGWQPAEAGAVAGALNVAGLPGTLLVTYAGDRVSRVRAFVASSAVSLVAVVGFAVASDLAWIWTISGGVALGAIFALVMTLPLDAADRPQEAGGYAAFMLGAGYALSSAAPAVLGALRDTSGSFTSSLWVLAATAALLLAGAPFLGRVRRPGAAVAQP